MAERKKNIVLISGTQMESTIQHLGGLIKKDYEVSYLFLGTKTGELPGIYPKSLKDDIITFIIKNKPIVIGVSIIDYEEKRICDLIRYMRSNKEIQKLSLKLIVGGAQVIEYPKRYLDKEGVDIVCYSRGWNFLEIIKGIDKKQLRDVKGIWIKNKKKMNLAPDLTVSIKNQPLPDYSLKNTYKIYNKRLVNAQNSGIMPSDHHQYPHKNSAVVVISEGCINNCEYCSIYQQDVRFKAYSSKRTKYSYRTPRDAVNVIKKFIKNNKKTEYVVFNDNDLAMLSIDDTEKLMKLYKKEIGLPFYCQCSPNTLKRGHIEAFVKGGLDMLEIGVQGSQKSNVASKYHRWTTDEMAFDFVRNTVPYLERRNKDGEVTRKGIKIGMDFINGNSAQNKESLMSTIDFIQKVTILIDAISKKTGSWNVAMHNLTLDEERDLAKEYAKVSKKISVGTPSESDYHNATIENFFKFKEFYLNILLGWLNGVNDQNHIGHLPRKLADFKKLIEKRDLNKLLLLVKKLEKGHRETLSLLIDEDVYKYLNSEEGKVVLLKIDSLLERDTVFSFHRKGRYDYDWAWAEKCIQ